MSSYPCPDFSVFSHVHPKDLSSSNHGRDTEIVRVASLSGTFEGKCKFYVR